MAKRSPKSNKVVARSVSKRFKRSLRSPLLLVVVAAVALLGGYFLYKSFALTNTVTYSGSFTKKHSSASYNVTATADGTLTAVASYSNTANFAMNVIAASGASLACTANGVNPFTLACPVTKGTYAIKLSGTPASKGSGSYTVTISYPVVDTVPPAASITSPASGTTISGQTNITGVATDNDGVSKVEISVDGGAYTTANLTGTSATNQTWGYLWDTIKVTNASHTLSVKVTDLTGNTTTATTTYTINNAVAPTDTTPPAISISSPANGSTVSGTTTFQGTSSDNVGVSKVQYKLDNASSWTAASGTSSWSFSVDTTALANNASHVIYVQALDAANNIGANSESVIVSNQTYTTTAPLTQGMWVSPEGMTINVNSAGTYVYTSKPWTIADVYQLIRACSAGSGDFGTIAPHYTVNLQDIYPAQTTTWANSYNGVYSEYGATTTYNGFSGAFASGPNGIGCYEYGHAWNFYYRYIVHQGDFSPYMNERWVNSSGTTLAQNDVCASGLDGETGALSSDYSILFSTTVPGSTTHSIVACPYVIPAANQPGLKDWLLNTWR